ncbi:Mitogen-activated protein kinase 15-1 MPK15-1 [Chondrus crispus]|uniref:Mitogen-activated protein kinase 15-1 MPK15-1 n=1 Tax=Chondrus crispus TaxID=2769 RepID=R7QTB9_CHOCR|nr:Mitogen-activated protein kinase 15-1 MPK15-1 [Chondrus crispus]CDF40756.1 Mitogen-activated protein kinase 15-1 MPK15-1 [Chondrus crispus]|eukprot:XP_005711050.1 Mitogen-activated protein kinase 15-1 MPK15-1 [Chondrus crispus]
MSSGHRQPPSVAERRARREATRREFFTPAVQANRYAVQKVIGEGAYGVVVCALDKVTNERVAVKRIKRVLDSSGMATRILRELKFLRFLHSHENIIAVKDVLIPGERDKFNDVFVVFELMPTDLGRLLRSKTVLFEKHAKFFMFQLLRGVNFMHSARVFHRDLNPNNILVNAECQLRICDFGLARAAFQRGDDPVFWTDYVATRWYRAPELILAQSSKYSTAIDMWSVGCIFAEILGKGKPLFPGANAKEQFSLILNVTGKPSRQVIARLGDRRLADYMDSVPNRPPASLADMYKGASPGAISLLQRLLTFDPDQRITALDALELPYFDDLRHFGYGQQTQALDERDFQFERRLFTANEMRVEFIKEIAAHHPEAVEELLGGPAARAGGGYRFMGPSQAEQFRQDMDNNDLQNGSKFRTLSTDTFAAINPEEQPQAGTLNFKSSTMGEAELSKYGGAPDHHASSFANHAHLSGGAGYQPPQGPGSGKDRPMNPDMMSGIEPAANANGSGNGAYVGAR